MFHKIRLGSALAALALFCFPWIDIQCSEKSLATQSGVQVIYGSGTSSSEKKDESVGFAPLVALALLAVIATIVFSLIAIFRGNAQASFWASILPAAALVLLLIQLIFGFPIQRKMHAMQEEAQPPEKRRILYGRRNDEQY